MLLKKLIRELRHQAGLVAAVVLVIALGVGLFVMSYAGYLNLDTSYDATEARLHLADRHVRVTRVDAEDLDAIGAIAGVEAAASRVVVSLPVRIPDGRSGADRRGPVTLEGRFLSLPDEGEPALDRIHLTAGALPSAPNEVVLESHVAQWHGLEPGDTVELRVGDDAHALRVSGVGVTPEYLWVARDEADILPSPSEFGVLWIRRGDLQREAKAVVRALVPDPAMLAAAGDDPFAEAIRDVWTAAVPGAGNELLLDVSGDPADAGLHEALERVLGEGAVLRDTHRDELIGPKLLRMDVDGMRQMAGFFPVFFLGVAASIVAALLSRLVDAQRPLVGTMLALGVARGRVLRHYLAFAGVIGVLGSVVGAVVGGLLGGAVTAVYAAELKIPFVAVEAHLELVAIGVAIGVGTSLVAGFFPARKAARLAPAEAMRPSTPTTGRALVLTRGLLGFLPLSARLALRNTVRRPFRSVATAGGVSAALILLVTTSALVESMGRAIEVQFDEAQRYDWRADLLAPMDADALRTKAEALDGDGRVEVALTLPVRIGDEDALLQAIAPDAELLRSVDFDGHVLLPDDGLVLPRPLARTLGVGVGDSVDVERLPSGPTRAFVVRGLSDTALGSTAIARLAVAQEAFDLDGEANTVLLGSATDARSGLEGIPGVVRVQDAGALRAQLDDLMALSWALVGMMLVMSAILAAAILYDTATLSILERSRELATLRALGRPMRAIAATTTLENGLLAVLGLAAGLPIAALTTRYAISLYDSDLFSLPFVLSGRTVGVSAVGVALVLLLAQWPALRQVARANLADTVRTREG